MRVAIAGAGNVGWYIARELVGNGHDVLLFEKVPEVANRLDTVPGIELRVADACEVTSLRDAKVDTCDAVVAATGDDEDNLLSRCSRNKSSRCRA